MSASWTDPRTKTFVTIVLDEIRRSGSFTDNSGLKSSQWTNIMAAFNQETGLQCDKAKLSVSFQN